MNCRLIVKFYIVSFLMASFALAADGWHLLDATILEGKAGAWDYIAMDANTNHLFIGRRKMGLQVFDVITNKLVKTINNTTNESSNGAILISEFDLGISTNQDGTVKHPPAEPGALICEPLEAAGRGR
jgi:hypothetical protein